MVVRYRRCRHVNALTFEWFSTISISQVRMINASQHCYVIVHFVRFILFYDFTVCESDGILIMTNVKLIDLDFSNCI